MAIVAFWLALIFFVGCLAMVWWLLLVDHEDLAEEPYEGEQQDNPLAGADGVSQREKEHLDCERHYCSIAGNGSCACSFVMFVCSREFFALPGEMGSSESANFVLPCNGKILLHSRLLSVLLYSSQ